MAIGDVFAVILGTVTTSYQPTTGVVQQISSASKSGTTDILDLYDGATSYTVPLYGANAQPGLVAGCTSGFNNSVIIDNAVYIKKQGTTDVAYIGGVQFNV